MGPVFSGLFLGAAIPFLSSQRRRSEPSNFAILLASLTLKTCQKISFSKQADSILATGFQGPKSFRDSRETGSRIEATPERSKAQLSLFFLSTAKFFHVVVNVIAVYFFFLTAKRIPSPLTNGF